MSDFFDLSINIKAIDKASANLHQIEKNSGEMSTNMKRHFKETADSLDKIGKKSIIMGSAIAAGLGIGVKTAANFEQELQNIKAVTGSSQSDMQKFHDLAIKAGVDTKYSAMEAAQGIEELAKAGLTTSQIMQGGLYGALNLATAGDISVADSAEIASTALNAFRDDHISVAKAADILSGAANASATSVGELKYSLSACSAVASSVGMSFKDTNTTLALLAQNGLKGSDAGTSLKTMLMNLQPHTKAQVGAFVQLGLAQGKVIKVSKDGKKTYQMMSNLFYDQHGKLKSLADITGILHDKLKTLNPAQRQAALYTLFGSDAIRAANILYKEGAKGANDMWAAMSKVTAAQVGETKMKSLNGSLETLMGSLQTIGIDMGESLLPGINAMVKGVTVLANTFESLPGPIKSVISIGGALTAVGLIGFGGLAIGVSSVMKAVVDVNGAFIGLSAKFPILGRGVLSVSRGFMNLQKAFLMSSPSNIITSLQILDKNLRVNITNSIKSLIPNIKASSIAFKEMSITSLKAIGPNIANGFKGVLIGLKALPASIGAVISGFKTLAITMLTSPVGWIGVAIAGGAFLIMKYWKPITAFFKGIGIGFKASMKPFAPELRKITNAIKPVLTWFKKLFTPINTTGTAAEAMGIKVGKVFGNIVKFLLKPVQLLTKFVSLFKAIPNKNININANTSSANHLPTAKSKGAMPKFDVGSRGITRTGVAVVHAGETINTAQQVRQGTGNIIHFSPQFKLDGADPKILDKVKQVVETTFDSCMAKYLKNQARLAY